MTRYHTGPRPVSHVCDLRLYIANLEHDYFYEMFTLIDKGESMYGNTISVRKPFEKYEQIPVIYSTVKL